MPQTTVLPEWKASYPITAPKQKPPGLNQTVQRTASASSWAAGKVTLTVPSLSDYVGSTYPMTISGFTPAGYNGNVVGTIASATSITYPLTADPGVSTVQGKATYAMCAPFSVSTTLTATDVPNKPSYSAGTIQLAEIEPPPEPPAEIREPDSA